jgi:hypothetical protein
VKNSCELVLGAPEHGKNKTRKSRNKNISHTKEREKNPQATSYQDRSKY